MSLNHGGEGILQRWFPALLAVLLAASLALFAAWKYGMMPAPLYANRATISSLQPGNGNGVNDAVPVVSQYFSPGDDLEELWVSHIKDARRFIHIACFGLSNPRIAEALEGAARDRHVEVIIIEDQRQAKLPADLHPDLSLAGCHIVIKRSRVLLHDKLGVFDGESAIIGSYNLSKSAEEQDNSAVVFDHDPEAAAKDETAWETMFQRETGSAYTPGMNLPPITPERSL